MSVVVRLVARTGCWELGVLGLLVDREDRSEAKCRVLLVLHGIRPVQWVVGALVECRLLVELMVVVWLVVDLGLS